jgi:hypothetical protein
MEDETVSDAILALALCECGHAVGSHDDDGCPGAHATFCMCTFTAAAALDDAIERVRRVSFTGSAHARRANAIAGRTLDADALRLQLDCDDYERVGPVRPLDPATMISLLAHRLIRLQ